MATTDSIKTMLVAMGFQPSHVERALKVYKKNYGYGGVNVEVITEIVVRLQNKDKTKLKEKSKLVEKPFHSLKMTLQRATQLKVNDKIDHRDCAGRYQKATIKDKQGDYYKIHYNGWSRKWDILSNYRTQLHRFAEYGSISQRPAHRLKHVKQGDAVLLNISSYSSKFTWKTGKINRTDGHSGQVHISFEKDDGSVGYSWEHLDDETMVKRSVRSKRKLDGNGHSSDVPRKKRKLNNHNTSSNVSQSQEQDTPKWIQCVDCQKWRIVLVSAANVANWTPPKDWRCNMNETYNKCTLPQQTDMLLRRKYSEKQLSALGKQRNAMMNHEEPLKEITSNNTNNTQTSESIANAMLKHQLQEMDEKLKKQKNKIKKLQTRNKNNEETSKQFRDQMNKKLSLYQGTSKEIHTLNLEQLNTLESELHNGLNVTKEARERLLENRLLCVICLTNSKNIVMQPCGHLDVCNECEATLPSKTCPRCQRPFNNCVAIKH
eukprot:680714_1